MTNSRPTPYPHPAEIIRELGSALGTKLSTATKDAVRSRETDLRILDALITDTISQPISNYIEPATGHAIDELLKNSLRWYLELVAKISLEGVNRSDSLPLLRIILLENFTRALGMLLHSQAPVIALPTLLMSERALESSFRWVEQQPWWGDIWRNLEKSDKDRIRAWRENTNLPDATGIKVLFEKATSANSTQHRATARTLLLLSRAIDSLRKHAWGSEFLYALSQSLLLDASGDPVARFQVAAHKLQQARQSALAPAFPFIRAIQTGLMKTTQKPIGSKDELRKALDSAREVLREVDPSGSSEFFIDWHEGRWHVLANDLSSARFWYEKAFSGCLFQGGDNMEEIIKEALCVAAAQPSPDQTLLRSLKKAAILFGFELPLPEVEEKKPENKLTDFMQPWEVRYWEAMLPNVFPPKGRFEPIPVEDIGSQRGPLIITKEKKIDLRNPNGDTKVGDTWTKKLPKLVWVAQSASSLKDVDLIKNLLEKGANVNRLSKSHESALLAAIQWMGIESPPNNPEIGAAIFDLLKNHQHSKHVINARTAKKRLTPLIESIKTGRPDVVKTVLEMGADPNHLGDADMHTPLYVCLQRISTITRPEIFWRSIEEVRNTPQALETIRRQSSNLIGASHSDIKQHMDNAERNPVFREFKRHMREYFSQQFNNYSLSALRRIAELLIQNGADPNAEQGFPIRGYTPLMLAAENDEADLFETMLDAGGDYKKTYPHPISGKPISCARIAQEFKSVNVMRLLKPLIAYNH